MVVSKVANLYPGSIFFLELLIFLGDDVVKFYPLCGV